MSEESDLIKEKIDLAELVGEYVQLKQVGQHFKARCPFHEEKTPSFIVSPDKGIWHCFGCQKGGDAFSFIQEIESVDFREALVLLADRVGVELRKSSAAPAQSQGRQRLFDLLDLAARYYHELLARHAVGARAREYLEQRGVKAETQQVFGLGWAPKSWDSLQQFLRAKGYSLQEMQAAGLVGESNRGTLYDRFRGRIMFPIQDVQGRTVAFGGRIAPWFETGEEGKYVNSPETDLYEKRKVVYNLHRAKQYLRQGQPVLVVEGYMDVVMLTQAGVNQVVASSGTAFTQEQIRQLGRFTRELHFAFDADAAGARAGVSAVREALTAGLRAATVVLPEGKDPADIVLEQVEELPGYLGSPRSIVSVLLERLQASSGREREEILREILPIVGAVENPVYQGELVQELAHTLHIPESRIIDEAARLIRQQLRPMQEDADEAGSPSLLSLEAYVLGLILLQPSLWQEGRAYLLHGRVTEKEPQLLVQALEDIEKQENLAEMGKNAMIERLPDEVSTYAHAVMHVCEERLAGSATSVEKEFQVSLRSLRKRWLEKRLVVLQDSLGQAKDTERLTVLEEFRDLTQELSLLQET